VIPGARQAFREWLDRFGPGTDAHFALEGTTGWRFAVEELSTRGFSPHLVDPAELSTLRGPKRRAKTDNADCDLMLKLLLEGRIPESWIPPAHIVELRTLVRLRKTLLDQRIEWQQRLQAQLFHQGVVPGLRMCNPDDRRRVLEGEVSPAGRQMIETGFQMLDDLGTRLDPLSAQLTALAKAQPGCRALQRQLFGVGWLTAVSILAELGDCRRFHSADQAVRASGLDVTVSESNGRRRAATSPGRGRRCCAGRCSRPPSAPVARLLRTTPPTGR
jgi:transposase